MWPRVVELLRPAIEYVDSGFSDVDILRRLQTSDMQLWVIGEYQAACVTQIIVYPQHKTCLVVALGGEGLEEWFDELMSTIETWAQELGCKYVEEYGRKGWARVGKRRGYAETYTVMRKAI
jgi:hypothetical protein